MPKSDATKCTGCGEPFVSGSGPYIRHGFDGLYHKRCLPHGPAPDQYRAGLIAGLKEAEAKARQFREHWSCAGGFGGHSAAARIIADTLSARIAALETEEGK